jgi:hypothetical protein
MYKLKEEPALVFDILWAQDGNDSLKRIMRRSPAADEDPSIPRPSCERTDTRKVLDDMYISREEVNKWAQEVTSQVMVASEGVSFNVYSTL